MSPYLFALYVNDIIADVEGLNVGCVMCFVPMCIILYADDILLLAPSVNALQLLLSTCELELRKLDLFINSAKSVCLRIGPRRSNNCQNLVTIDGNNLNWESCIRYLGVYIESAGHFRCSHEVAKKKFYSSFNGIFGKIGRIALEEVILISPACCERLRHCHSILRNLNHSRILLSAFCSKCLTLGGSADIVTQFQEFFNFPDVSKLIFRRKRKLNNRFTIMKNLLCNTVNFKFQTVD